MNIYYYYPFTLNFNSAATIQVIKDYKYLSKHGYRVFFYGTYDDEKSFQAIKDFIGNDPIFLQVKKEHSRWNRNLLKFQFLYKILCDRSSKLIISRNYNKISEVCSFKALLGKHKSILEMHEDTLPYLLSQTKPENVKKIKDRYQNLFKKLDALILTNYSQEVILKQEFAKLPYYGILPNGVEIEKLSWVSPSEENSEGNYILTYAGQFTPWKNVELIFQATSFLDKRYHLRIAGGKGNEESRKLIQEWTEKYHLEDRVDYKGFVQPENVPRDVLQGTSALLVPLGDNMESRHFTSPMKLFEYMGTKIPVVAVDYHSVSMVTGSETVFLSANDPKQFAQAIREAVEGDPLVISERISKMNEVAKKYDYKNRALNMHKMIQGLRSCNEP